MKVGILTLPFNNNYGGLLQSYALQSFLKERGHDVWLIKRVSNLPKLKEIFKKNIKKLLRWSGSDANMKFFEHQYMQETEMIDKPVKYKLLDKYIFDAYVAGSDQIWRFAYTKERKEEYFLNFVSDKNAKKIAFAASFGVDYWDVEKEQTSIFVQLLKKFDAVSVREKTGINLCKDYLNYNNAIQLFDSTLLMSVDFYRSLYDGKEIDNSGKIGVYLLDPNEQKKQLLSEFEKKCHIPSFIIGAKKNGNKYYYPRVSQWIKDFDTAEYIITDSFHGMVFSIVFKKPFCVFGNKQRGLSRFSSLLSVFHLENRLIDIDDISLVNINNLLPLPDYSLSSEILKLNKGKSTTFFKTVGL